MIWPSRIAAFLHRLLHRSQAEEDLQDEIRAHFAVLAERHGAREARIRFGGPEQAAQSVREVHFGAVLETTVQDLRYGLRSLLKSPIATAVAVVSLALGIGANTAIFSVMNAVLLRSLPIPDPGQLISIFTIQPEDGGDINLLSLAMLREVGKRQSVFSGMFAWDGAKLDSFEAEGKYFAGMMTSVTGEYFTTLGVQPLLGRLIEPSDVALSDGPSAPVAVLGYRCWQTRFHGDPAILGKTIRADGVPLTIVGVTPPAFSGLVIDLGEDVVTPLGAKGDIDFRQREHLRLGGYGRLKPGVTFEQARAQLEAIWPSVLRAAEPEGYSGARRTRYYARKIEIEPLANGHSRMRERLSKPLGVLMALVGMVLLIGCVNLANLMLARAAGRRHELAVRTALGAGPWRLARQLLTESMLLSLSGAALGFAAAIPASRLLLATAWTSPVPLVLNAAPDLRVLAFTAGVSLLTAALFGLAPAFRSARTDPAISLSRNTRSVRGAARAARVLVSAQVALSMVMVLAAALFVHSLKNLDAVDPGFTRHGVIAMQLMAQPGRQVTSNLRPYYREMVDKVESLPGVVSASFSVIGPVNRGESKDAVAAAGSALPPEVAAGDVVGPEFFRTVGMRVLAGREFDWRDDENAPPVTVISQSLAARLFPNGNPVGQYVNLDPGVNQKRLRVIGVVNNASLWRIQSRQPKALYQPLLQTAPTGSYLDIRASGNVREISTGAAKIVEGLGHEYPLYIQTLEERFGRMTVDERMVAWLSAFFGALALLLAAIGLYGLMAEAVLQRTPEIGIRMALGAARGNVVRMVLREALLLTAVGIAAGIPAALAASKLIAGMLFGLSASDPETILIAAGVLFGVALFAGYLPARFASRIDPMTALRAA